jgi:hypothetical protein
LKLASFVHIEFPGLLQHASAWFRAHYRPLFSAPKALLSPTSLTPFNEAGIIRLREDWRWQRGSGEFSIAPCSLRKMNSSLFASFVIL